MLLQALWLSHWPMRIRYVTKYPDPDVTRVEVFHAVAATAENGEDGPYYLAVLIAYQLTAKS